MPTLAFRFANKRQEYFTAIEVLPDEQLLVTPEKNDSEDMNTQKPPKPARKAKRPGLSEEKTEKNACKSEYKNSQRRWGGSRLFAGIAEVHCGRCRKMSCVLGRSASWNALGSSEM